MKSRIVWGLVCLGTFLWGFALGGAFGRAQVLSDSLPIPLFLIGALCVLSAPALFQMLKKADAAQMAAGKSHSAPLPDVFKNLRLYGSQAPIFENRQLRSEAYVVVRPFELEFGRAAHLVIENWGLSSVRLNHRGYKMLLAPKAVIRLSDSNPNSATLRIEADMPTTQDPELLIHFFDLR